jgi:hypothetical protein
LSRAALALSTENWWVRPFSANGESGWTNPGLAGMPTPSSTVATTWVRSTADPRAWRKSARSNGARVVFMVSAVVA